MVQITFQKYKPNYFEAGECCANDYAVPVRSMKDELEQLVGHEVKSPVIVEEDGNPCPASCEVVRGLVSDEECLHCGSYSLTMGYTQPYLRKLSRMR